MFVSEGTLIARDGKAVKMSDVSQASKDAAPNDELAEYWTYDCVGKGFAPLRMNKIAEKPKTCKIYEIETEDGGKIVLPDAAKLYIERHGIETLVVVQALRTFRNWASCQVCRVVFNPETKTCTKTWTKIKSLSDVKFETPEQEMPVFNIRGAAEVARLLVINGFLVG